MSDHDRAVDPGAVWHVAGPPGCGKTTWLARQAGAAVERHGPGGVLIVSLTRAAATEIGGRDTGVLAENVGTLHSVCYRAAGRRPVVLDSPKGVKVWNQWIADAGRPTWALSGGLDADDPGDRSTGTTGDELLAEVCMLRHRLVPRERWTPRADAFAREWGRCLEEIDGTDFTLMLEAGLQLERAPGDPAVLIGDEGQDWTPLEAAVVRRWSAAALTTIVAADEDQTIYGFRGADARVFIDAPVPEARRRVLGQSYRVPRAVHAMAQRVIRTVRGRTDVEYAPTAEPGSVDVRDDARWARPEPWLEDVLAAVARAEAEAPGDPRRGAMLIAPCGYMLAPAIAALRREGVPYANHYRPAAGHWNPLGRVGEGVRTAADQLLAYLGGGPGAPWTWGDLRAWLPLQASARMGQGRLAIGAKRRLESYQGDPAARPTDGEWRALWAREEDAAAARARDARWLLAGCSAADRRRLEYPLAVLRRRGPAALRRRPSLTIGTIHSVKGGEARDVYALTALPPRWALDPTSDDLARLFYVALTRASRSVTVLQGDGGGYRV